MKIVPDYKHKEIKCYYCNKNIADETCGNTQELICISQPHLASYDYVYVKVEVPRCKECSKKHSIAFLPFFLCILIILAIVIIKVIIPQWNGHSVWEMLLFSLLMIFLSCLGGAIVGFIPRWIMFLLLKVRNEDDVDEYSPIRKLKGIGFRKDKPKPHTHPRARFNEENYKKTLNSIIYNDNCVVKN